MTTLIYNSSAGIVTRKRNLIDSRHKEIPLDNIEDDDIIQHWSDPKTYADVVLNIFNNERCYDDVFKDKENLTILDIGGNIGLFSLYIQSRAKEVYCLEPTPSHFNILKKYTKNYNNIHPLNIALTRFDGDINFYTCSDNSTMNSIDSRNGSRIVVTGKKIGTLLKDLNLDHVDFVKLDIEGGEILAITQENLNEVKDKIDMWFVEVHDGDGKNITQNREVLSDIFTQAGYSVEHYKHDTLYARKSK